MEFFAEVAVLHMPIQNLQSRLSMAALPELCESIDTLLEDRIDHGEIYCLWGQFTVSRQPIRHGVRFALLDCPHALAWTVTYHAAHQALVIHCTIDDRETEAEFVETIERFVSDWKRGLEQALKQQNHSR